MVQIFDNINYFWHTSVMPKLLLIPLEDTVVFPGMDVTLPVDVGEESRVLLVPRHGSDYANVGVVAEVGEHMRLPGRIRAVSLSGLHRAVAGAANSDPQGRLWVEIDEHPDETPAPSRTRELEQEYRAVVEEILELRGDDGRVSAWVRSITDPGALADTSGYAPDFSYEQKVELLQTLDVVERLAMALRLQVLEQLRLVVGFDAHAWLLTDPVLERRIGLGRGFAKLGPRRLIQPALGKRELPPLDGVLLSHAHMDHTDLGTLRAIPPRVRVVVQAGNRDLVRRFHAVDELAWGKAMVAAWNAKYPKEKVTAQEIPAGKTSEEVIGAAITAGNAPCLVLNTSPAAVPQFQKQGGLVPLENFKGAVAYLKARSGATLDQYKSPDGKHYQIPWKSNPVMIFYNKDMLKKAGISTTNPPLATYADFLATAGEAKWGQLDVRP